MQRPPAPLAGATYAQEASMSPYYEIYNDASTHEGNCLCVNCVWGGEPALRGRDDRRERLAQKAGF